jgi:hypothetical protein
MNGQLVAEGGDRAEIPGDLLGGAEDAAANGGRDDSAPAVI